MNLTREELMDEWDRAEEVVQEARSRPTCETCNDTGRIPYDHSEGAAGQQCPDCPIAPDHYGFEKAVASGFYEAGNEEPWCEDHGVPERRCYSCLGASHDAWMHRAKAAEAALQELVAAIPIGYSKHGRARRAVIGALELLDGGKS